VVKLFADGEGGEGIKGMGVIKEYCEEGVRVGEVIRVKTCLSEEEIMEDKEFDAEGVNIGKYVIIDEAKVKVIHAGVVEPVNPKQAYNIILQTFLDTQICTPQLNPSPHIPLASLLPSILIEGLQEAFCVWILYGIICDNNSARMVIHGKSECAEMGEGDEGLGIEGKWRKDLKRAKKIKWAGIGRYVPLYYLEKDIKDIEDFNDYMSTLKKQQIEFGFECDAFPYPKFVNIFIPHISLTDFLALSKQHTRNHNFALGILPSEPTSSDLTNPSTLSTWQHILSQFSTLSQSTPILPPDISQIIAYIQSTLSSIGYSLHSPPHLSDHLTLLPTLPNKIPLPN